jgi:class 3 adenylate cyclase
MNDRNAERKNLFETLAELLAQDIDPNTRAEELWQRFGQERAVMVLDSTGFSRVSERHGIIHFLARLVLMRERVVPVLQRQGSREFNFAADNVFATFDSASAAIRAAEAAHAAIFASHLMLTEEEPFRICIGIGYGRLLYSETLE